MAYVVSIMNDFCGGERDAIAPDTLDWNEMIVCENMDPDISGGLVQRFGTDTTHTNISTTRKLRTIEWDYLTGSTRTIKRLEVFADKIIDPDIPDAGQNYKVLYTGTIESVDDEAFGAKLYILTGNDYLVYDGTTITSVTQAAGDSMLADIKKCRYLVKHRDRMFFGHNKDFPNNLYYSQRLDPTYIKNSSGGTTINPIQALTDDSDGITGLATYSDALIVYKRYSVFAWTGVDPLTDVKFQRLNSHTGTIAHRTIRAVDNYLFFLGYDKQVYMLHTADTGVVSVMPVSTKKRTAMDKIKLDDLPHKATACAIYWDGKYILSAATGDVDTENDTVFVFHVNVWKRRGFQECWTTYKGLAITDFDVSITGALYMACVEGGKTVRANKTGLTDSGAQIIGKLKVRSFDGSDKAKEYALYQKKYKIGAIFCRQFDQETTVLDVHHKVDYLGEDEDPVTIPFDESGIWDYSDWDLARFGTNDASKQNFMVRKSGLKLEIEMSTHPGVEDSIVCIYAIGVKYKVKKMR